MMKEKTGVAETAEGPKEDAKMKETTSVPKKEAAVKVAPKTD